jgi:hypothetical protein
MPWFERAPGRCSGSDAVKRIQRPAKRRLSEALVEQHDGVRHPKHRHYDRSTNKKQLRNLMRSSTEDS